MSRLLDRRLWCRLIPNDQGVFVGIWGTGGTTTEVEVYGSGSAVVVSSVPYRSPDVSTVVVSVTSAVSVVSELTSGVGVGGIPRSNSNLAVSVTLSMTKGMLTGDGERVVESAVTSTENVPSGIFLIYHSTEFKPGVAKSKVLSLK